MKKRIICILMLCFILCYNNFIKVNASNDKVRVYSKEDTMDVQNNTAIPYISLESVQPRMIITQTVAVGLSIEGNQAICSTTVVGVTSEVKRVKIVMHLQERKTNGDYYDIAKWESSRDGVGLSIEKYYPLSSRGTYRVQADAYVYDYYNNCELNFFWSYERQF